MVFNAGWVAMEFGCEECHTCRQYGGQLSDLSAGFLGSKRERPRVLDLG